MKKRKQHTKSPINTIQEKPATLKDMLSADILDQLKLQAEELRKAEEQQKAEKRKLAEEARKAEQKRLENDFEYLLNHSNLDWKQHK